MNKKELIFTLGELGPIEGFEESVVTERTITDEELKEWDLK